MTSETQDPFDQIMQLLEGDEDAIRQPPQPATGDAIDRILARPARRTRVRSLRDHPAIIGFRRELEDDLVRADSVRQVLGLIRLAIEAKLS